MKRDRATRLLAYLGDVIVNGRPDVKGKVDPTRHFPHAPIPQFATRMSPLPVRGKN